MGIAGTFDEGNTDPVGELDVIHSRGFVIDPTIALTVLVSGKDIQVTIFSINQQKGAGGRMGLILVERIDGPVVGRSAVAPLQRIGRGADQKRNQGRRLGSFKHGKDSPGPIGLQ